MTVPEYSDPRLTEKRNPNTQRIDIATSEEIVDLIHTEDKSVPLAVYSQKAELARAIDLAASSIGKGGRIIYVGAGTSGRLGVLDASECPPTFGTDPGQVVGVIAGGFPALVKSQEGAEDDVNAGIAAMNERQVSEKDFVVGIAASGSTPFVRAALGRAQARGATTAIVCCTAPPPVLASTCDVAIVAQVGPEVITGSTRMKAGTATKMILNTITTGAMIRLNKAYGNLMVDLMATSDKLTDRGQRIVMEVCGVSRAEAADAIESADGSVKLAIVMLKCGVQRTRAIELLGNSNGVLREVIGDPPEVGS